MVKAACRVGLLCVNGEGCWESEITVCECVNAAGRVGLLCVNV